MKKIGMAVFLFASLSGAQEPGSYQPATTNVYGATSPCLEVPVIGARPPIHSTLGGSQK